MQCGWDGVSFLGKRHYEGVRFNVIIITKGWVGVKFPGKKRYVTLAWPNSTFEEKKPANDETYLNK